MSLSILNTFTCLLIAAFCVWSEISRHTKKSLWLSMARSALALTALIEGSWYAQDQAIALAQALMNIAVAFLFLVVFIHTQIEAVNRAQHDRASTKDYLKHFCLFWQW